MSVSERPPACGQARRVGLLAGIAPLDYFGFAGTLGTIPIILTYMLTNLALPVYVIRYHRSDLDILRHILLPIAGTLVMLFPLWGLIQPGQLRPFNVFPWSVPMDRAWRSRLVSDLWRRDRAIVAGPRRPHRRMRGRSG
jgi:amino acid transporter